MSKLRQLTKQGLPHYKVNRKILVDPVQNGIQAWLNSKKKWILFIEIEGKRKNKTICRGQEGLVKAIKTAEAISLQLEPKASINTWSQAQQVQQGSHPNQDVPKFLDYSKRWLKNNAGRWDEQTMNVMKAY